MTRLLTINAGSSSVKANTYLMGPTLGAETTALIERIGQPGGQARISGADGDALLESSQDYPDHESAMAFLVSWYREHGLDREVVAIGHRVVHGGSEFHEPLLITDAVLVALDGLVPLAPEHMPQAIDAIRAMGAAFPTVKQVACFDTAFHRTMPRVAQLLPLPRAYLEQGLRRFGFHGLSYEYIMQELRALDPARCDGRVIVAHLGNGASMAAVRGGVSIDTTMGFTPAGGIMMGTRTGDLDPGALVHIAKAERLDPAGIDTLVNKRSGMLGVSGFSSDMRDLLEHEAADPGAADALALFCYEAKKSIGALVAVLGGIETLVFTAGIGEHSAGVRARICADLEVFGIELDTNRNAARASIISRDGAAVTVRVIPTDEDLMIARHTRDVAESASALG